jgi:hypothetical protein
MPTAPAPGPKEATNAPPLDGRETWPPRHPILVQDAAIAVLKARLPDAPQHPRALETLAEGVALWYGRPLYAALGARASRRSVFTLRVRVAYMGATLGSATMTS